MLGCRGWTKRSAIKLTDITTSWEKRQSRKKQSTADSDIERYYNFGWWWKVSNSQCLRGFSYSVFLFRRIWGHLFLQFFRIVIWRRYGKPADWHSFACCWKVIRLEVNGFSKLNGRSQNCLYHRQTILHIQSSQCQIAKRVGMQQQPIWMHIPQSNNSKCTKNHSFRPNISHIANECYVSRRACFPRKL